MKHSICQFSFFIFRNRYRISKNHQHFKKVGDFLLLYFTLNLKASHSPSLKNVIIMQNVQLFRQGAHIISRKKLGNFMKRNENHYKTQFSLKKL